MATQRLSRLHRRILQWLAADHLTFRTLFRRSEALWRSLLQEERVSYAWTISCTTTSCF